MVSGTVRVLQCLRMATSLMETMIWIDVMVLEFMNGKMAGCMKENSTWINDKVWVNTAGLMVQFIEENFCQGIVRVKAPTHFRMALRILENG